MPTRVPHHLLLRKGRRRPLRSPRRHLKGAETMTKARGCDCAGATVVRDPWRRKPSTCCSKRRQPATQLGNTACGASPKHICGVMCHRSKSYSAWRTSGFSTLRLRQACAHAANRCTLPRRTPALAMRARRPAAPSFWHISRGCTATCGNLCETVKRTKLPSATLRAASTLGSAARSAKQTSSDS